MKPLYLFFSLWSPYETKWNWSMIHLFKPVLLPLRHVKMCSVLFGNKMEKYLTFSRWLQRRRSSINVGVELPNSITTLSLIHSQLNRHSGQRAATLTACQLTLKSTFTGKQPARDNVHCHRVEVTDEPGGCWQRETRRVNSGSRHMSSTQPALVLWLLMQSKKIWNTQPSCARGLSIICFSFPICTSVIVLIESWVLDILFIWQNRKSVLKAKLTYIAFWADQSLMTRHFEISLGKRWNTSFMPPSALYVYDVCVQ